VLTVALRTTAADFLASAQVEQGPVHPNSEFHSRSAGQTNHTLDSAIAAPSSWATAATAADTAATVATAIAAKAMPTMQLIGPRTGPGTICAAEGLPSARRPATRSAQAALSSREEFATRHTN